MKKQAVVIAALMIALTVSIFPVVSFGAQEAFVEPGAKFETIYEDCFGYADAAAATAAGYSNSDTTHGALTVEEGYPTLTRLTDTTRATLSRKAPALTGGLGGRLRLEFSYQVDTTKKSYFYAPWGFTNFGDRVDENGVSTVIIPASGAFHKEVNPADGRRDWVFDIDFDEGIYSAQLNGELLFANRSLEDAVATALGQLQIQNRGTESSGVVGSVGSSISIRKYALKRRMVSIYADELPRAEEDTRNLGYSGGTSGIGTITWENGYPTLRRTAVSNTAVTIQKSAPKIENDSLNGKLRLEFSYEVDLTKASNFYADWTWVKFVDSITVDENGVSTSTVTIPSNGTTNGRANPSDAVRNLVFDIDFDSGYYNAQLNGVMVISNMKFSGTLANLGQIKVQNRGENNKGSNGASISIRKYELKRLEPAPEKDMLENAVLYTSDNSKVENINALQAGDTVTYRADATCIHKRPCLIITAHYREEQIIGISAKKTEMINGLPMEVRGDPLCLAETPQEGDKIRVYVWHGEELSPIETDEILTLQ